MLLDATPSPKPALNWPDPSPPLKKYRYISEPESLALATTSENLVEASGSEQIFC